MTDTPWTPGPWHVAQDHGNSPFVRVVVGENHSFVTSKTPDARLIAAAPEMADLLAEAVDWIEHARKRSTLPMVLVDSRRLLARIRGET